MRGNLHPLGIEARRLASIPARVRGNLENLVFDSSEREWISGGNYFVKRVTKKREIIDGVTHDVTRVYLEYANTFKTRAIGEIEAPEISERIMAQFEPFSVLRRIKKK